MSLARSYPLSALLLLVLLAQIIFWSIFQAVT